MPEFGECARADFVGERLARLADLRANIGVLLDEARYVITPSPSMSSVTST